MKMRMLLYSKPSCAYQVHRNEHKDMIQSDKRAKKKYIDSEFINEHFEKSDILITHVHAAGFGDCGDDTNIKGRCTGSYPLLNFIHKTRPKLFICCDFHGSEYGTHGHGVHFIRFSNDRNSNAEQKVNFENDEFCIAINVAIAHQPARHMRKDNVRRGVCIVDIALDDIKV